MIRLIASDCDGTLLNLNSELDKETIEAINRFQENGGIFMLATGRNRWDAAEITKQLNGCVLNCDNGTALFDRNGEKLLIHEIAKQKVRMIHNLSEHSAFPVLYHGTEATYINYDFESFRKNALNQIISVHGDKMADDIFDWIFNNGYYRYGTELEKIMDNDIIKLEPMFIDEKEYGLIIDECRKIFSGMNIYIGTFLNNIEINSAESDKGRAILEYCKLKGIRNDEVIVIGDSNNDIPMFTLFENSCCVRSGQNAAKKAAKHVIDGSDELGVAKLINSINNNVQ